MTAGEEFLFGDSILSVDAFDGVREADGDELGFGKRTPSKEIPLTSSFTTNCGSPVDEFSVLMGNRFMKLNFEVILSSHLY